MQSQHHVPGFTVHLADPADSQDTTTGASAGGTAGASAGGTAPRGFRQRRRNRHGRGLRGEVMLPNVPGYRTRAEKFDDLVLDSAERLQDMWGKRLDGVAFAVEEIPPNLEQLVAQGTAAPLGAYTPASHEAGPVITVYRRVVVHTTAGIEDLQDLVHDVVVEYTAEMLGVPPESLDPVYRRRYQ